MVLHKANLWRSQDLNSSYNFFTPQTPLANSFVGQTEAVRVQKHYCAPISWISTKSYKAVGTHFSASYFPHNFQVLLGEMWGLLWLWAYCIAVDISFSSSVKWDLMGTDGEPRCKAQLTAIIQFLPLPSSHRLHWGHKELPISKPQHAFIQGLPTSSFSLGES